MSMSEIIADLKAAMLKINPQEHEKLHAIVFSALVEAESQRRAPHGPPRLSFAGPYKFGGSSERSADCTCGDAWELTYEENEFADSGIDTVAWHAADCGFWRRHMSREDFRREFYGEEQAE